jgi:autotransporter-associated beta strand protein
MPTHRHPALTPLHAAIVLALACAAAPAFATPFTIATGSTTAQTLGAGETGTVDSGAALTVSGSTVAVTVKGSNATLNNDGTIAQTGTGRAVRDNTGVANLVVNNRGTMRTADADVIQMNVPAASVTLNNYGTMVSQNASAGGAQAVDFSAMTGANVVSNYAGAVLQAGEADAVRPGANGIVNNAGTIRSTSASGGSSDAIDGQNNSGIRVTNAATGVVDSARHGITGGQASSTTDYTMSVTNAAGGIIRGNNGSGINVDGFNGRQVLTVANAGTIVGHGTTGDGDGIDADGLVDITNTSTGIIRSTNAFNLPSAGMAYSEGITAGGGRIVNAGTIEGLVAAGNTNAVGRGITLAGNDITSGAQAGTREGLYGNATIVNQAGGTIRGQGDAAIVAQGAASGFTVTINNNAGATILGGGATTAAIRTGADRTVITNAGVIDGSSSGKAIQMGSGDNALVISGGAARVVGSIDGGSGGKNTLVVDAGKGNQFAYAGSISNFASVEIRSGTTTLSGQSTYGGATILSGGTLALAGSNLLSADSALVLAGGTLDLRGAGKGGQTFANLTLADSSVIDFGDAALTFNGLGSIAGGKHLTLTDVDATSHYVLRFLGDFMNDANFQALMRQTAIDNIAVTYRFDGTYTNVFGASEVPEPGSIALVLGGMGLLGVLRRRRKAVA